MRSHATPCCPHPPLPPCRAQGTAFPTSERDRLGIRGLIPPKVSSLETQLLRVVTDLFDNPTYLTPGDEEGSGVTPDHIRRW